MARLPRLDLLGIPQHVDQRGNNRLPCFLDDPLAPLTAANFPRDERQGPPRPADRSELERANVAGGIARNTAHVVPFAVGQAVRIDEHTGEVGGAGNLEQSAKRSTPQRKLRRSRRRPGAVAAEQARRAKVATRCGQRAGRAGAAPGEDAAPLLA